MLRDVLAFGTREGVCTGLLTRWFVVLWQGDWFWRDRNPSLNSSVTCPLPQVGDAGLTAIAAYGPQLSTLSLNYTHRWSGRSLVELAAALPRLKVFSAVAAAGLTDDALAALGASCPELSLVRVDRCPGVTVDGVLRLVNRSTNRDAGSMLQRVEMAGVFRQSGPEQRAYFERWVQVRGFRFDERGGLLTLSPTEAVC